MPVEVSDDAHFEQQQQQEVLRKKEEARIQARKVAVQVDQSHPTLAQRERKQQQIFKYKTKRGQDNPIKQIKAALQAEQDVEEIQKQRRDQVVDAFDGGGEVHDAALKVLSYPARDPLKRRLLEHRLRKSKIINDYLRNKVIFKVAHYLGEDLRALCTYAYYLNDSRVEVDDARALQSLGAGSLQ